MDGKTFLSHPDFFIQQIRKERGKRREGRKARLSLFSSFDAHFDGSDNAIVEVTMSQIFEML